MIKEFPNIAIIAGNREIDYGQMLQKVSLFARFTPQGKHTRTLLFSENREGWIYAFFAIWAQGGIAVPVDAGSTPHDVAYILNDSNPSGIWTSAKLLPVVEEAMRISGTSLPVRLIDDYELTTPEGEKASIRRSDEETALIIYTSGTTGNPKGVMLSFANLYANIRAVSEEVPIFAPHRRTMILLPLHHVLPLLGSMIAPILIGAGVAICPSMSGPDIMDTLCRGKVGIIIGVPRLWQTLYQGIKKKIDVHLATRLLFALCARVGSKKFSRTIFASVHKKMGGHLDYCVSGGAALDREIGEGLRTLGLDVLEGYGMTEAAPMISFTRPDDIIPGCCGKPLPSVTCKLVNGELWAKGPNIMQGYYGKPRETAEALDADGFLHTGDLARFDEEGRLYITGRSKEIIVLSNGKNVQPAEIEYKLEKYTERVKEAAVVQDGDLLRSIIVPQPEWAARLTEGEVETALKREVLEPYNRTVANYKKVMSIFVYRGELPRTKLDKLQRFKLKDILASGAHRPQQESQTAEPQTEEYRLVKAFLEGEKKVKVMPHQHLETDLALDSLDKVSLQNFIENTFGTEVKVEQMAAFADVAALCEHIAQCKTRTTIENADWCTLIHEDSSRQALPRTSWLYQATARMLGGFHKLYNRLEVKGCSHIPAKGPFILAPNHQSYIDSPLVLAGLDNRTLNNCYFYATEDHVKGTLVRGMASRCNVILMERRNLKNSILKMAEVLKQGKNIVIFPEGTRSRNGKVAPFKKTFAILSKELQVPVVPVCIKGAYESLPRGSRWPKPCKVTVEYLAPIMPQDTQDYEAFAETVRAAIQKKADQ